MYLCENSSPINNHSTESISDIQCFMGDMYSKYDRNFRQIIISPKVILIDKIDVQTNL